MDLSASSKAILRTPEAFSGLHELSGLLRDVAVEEQSIAASNVLQAPDG